MHHRLYIHVNGLATLYKKYFRHPPYSHVINCVRGAPARDFSYSHSVLSPEVDESTIQLPSLLLVVGAVSLPLKCEYFLLVSSSLLDRILVNFYHCFSGVAQVCRDAAGK